MFKICRDAGFLRALLIIKNAFKICCIAIPIVLIITGILLFGKTVISSEQDEIKKSFTQLIKKIIAGLIVLILPTIISFFINLAGDYSTIQICLDNATSENLNYYEKMTPILTEINDLLLNPTETSLNRVKSMYNEIKGSLKEDDIVDLLADISTAEIKVDSIKLMQECRNKGGTYERGYCKMPVVIEVDHPTSGGNSGTDALTFDSSNYSVVKGPVTVEEFDKFLLSHGVYQASNKSEYNDKCLGFSYTHAYALYIGDKTITGDNGRDYKYDNTYMTFTDDNKQKILGMIYDEISNNRPVVLQVNGNKEGTSRHFVTVVGYKNGVTSSTIQETDLLIIDSYDGKLEKMEGNGSRFMTTGAACHKDYTGYRIEIMKQRYWRNE